MPSYRRAWNSRLSNTEEPSFTSISNSRNSLTTAPSDSPLIMTELKFSGAFLFNYVFNKLVVHQFPAQNSRLFQA